MSSSPLDNPRPPSDAARLSKLIVAPPTIKILLYTDDPDDIPPTDETCLGLGPLIERLNAHRPTFARLCVKWVSRSSSNEVHADNKIDDVLREEEKTGQPFDEIWFFGLHQANTEVPSDVFGGGPESELSKNEVDALQKWMGKPQRGGVLISGDHGHQLPPDLIPSNNPPCPDTSAGHQFLGRGRAIGRCVPRAGLLRVWEGEPTNRSVDSYDTLEGPGIETDMVPQKLTLINVNPDGEFDPDGQPHPIFHYKPGSWITVLPDHVHEGALKFDPKSWKEPTRPQVVAQGTNKRTSEVIDIVMTYNGDLDGVGRIVADSSWHHYFNVNLTGFPHPAPEGTPADKIGQFYGNLAVWLAPPGKRREMTHAMCWRLAKYTLLMDVRGDVRQIGREAYAILSQIAAPCEVQEMFHAVTPEPFRALYFPGRGQALSHLPSQELLLGSILNSYHEEMAPTGSPAEPHEPRGADEIIESGFMDAFQRHARQLSEMASETRKLIKRKIRVIKER